MLHQRMFAAYYDEGISELVDQPDLEGLQREESLVRWQGPIAQSPQCAGADAADADQTPEQVFPPFPA